MDSGPRDRLAAPAATETQSVPPTVPTPPPPPILAALSERSRVQILDALEHRLHLSRNPIVTDQEAFGQLRDQIDSVLQ